jgi:hypothetical protein
MPIAAGLKTWNRAGSRDHNAQPVAAAPYSSIMMA